MQDQTFFTGTNRRVILGSPTLQSTSRRVCIPIRMPLTGESFTNMPDWVGEAYEAVSKYLTEASPQVQQVADLMLAFSNDKPKGELFAHPSAKVSSAELKAFSVVRVGDPEDDPEVELQFKAYAPYARDFWAWIGETAGQEVYMAFPSSLGKSATAKPAQATLIDDKVTDAEKNALAGDANPVVDKVVVVTKAPRPETKVPQPGTPEYERQVRESMGAAKTNGQTRMVRSEPPRHKNGPKELAAEQAKHLAAEQSKQDAKGNVRGIRTVN
jgi:hypothetical protein